MQLFATSRRIRGKQHAPGEAVEELHELTSIDPWFLTQIGELVELEGEVRGGGLAVLDAARLRLLKRKGFADSRLAQLAGEVVDGVGQWASSWGSWKAASSVSSRAGISERSCAKTGSTWPRDRMARAIARPSAPAIGASPAGIVNVPLAEGTRGEGFRAAVEAGTLRTLKEDAAAKVVAGITTLEEAASAVLV